MKQTTKLLLIAAMLVGQAAAYNADIFVIAGVPEGRADALRSITISPTEPRVIAGLPEGAVVKESRRIAPITEVSRLSKGFFVDEAVIRDLKLTGAQLTDVRSWFAQDKRTISIALHVVGSLAQELPLDGLSKVVRELTSQSLEVRTVFRNPQHELTMTYTFPDIRPGVCNICEIDTGEVVTQGPQAGRLLYHVLVYIWE